MGIHILFWWCNFESLKSENIHMYVSPQIYILAWGLVTLFPSLRCYFALKSGGN